MAKKNNYFQIKKTHANRIGVLEMLLYARQINEYTTGMHCHLPAKVSTALTFGSRSILHVV